MLILVFQFLSHDIPLFQGIISDLFPGVDLPEADYGHLEEALIEHITKRKLQPSRWFIEKIIQVKQRAMVHWENHSGETESNGVPFNIVNSQYACYTMLIKERNNFFSRLGEVNVNLCFCIKKLLNIKTILFFVFYLKCLRRHEFEH